MGLFKGNGQQTQQVNAQQAMAQLKNDPVGTLKQCGLNIPAGMNDPQQITRHLMQTGQIPQNRFTQAMQMMGQMMRR